MTESDEAPESPSLTRRRRTFLAPLWAMWLLAVGVFAILVAVGSSWHSAATTTVVLVRHAEKQLGAISDAPLSPEGEKRADRLAQMFGDSQEFGRIRKIYVTNTRRTQQTALRLSQRIGLNSEVVDAKTDSKGRRGFVGEEAALAALIGALSYARKETAEPVGLLSHHLAMDDGAWDFLRLVLERTKTLSDLRVRSAHELFAGKKSEGGETRA